MRLGAELDSPAGAVAELLELGLVDALCGVWEVEGEGDAVESGCNAAFVERGLRREEFVDDLKDTRLLKRFGGFYIFGFYGCLWRFWGDRFSFVVWESDGGKRRGCGVFRGCW